jgi:putative oxidoreductase
MQQSKRSCDFKYGVPLFSLTGLAGLLATGGGHLAVFGLFTRYAAFVLSGMMAVAHFMAHAPQKFHPILNGGKSAILHPWRSFRSFAQ